MRYAWQYEPVDPGPMFQHVVRGKDGVTHVVRDAPRMVKVNREGVIISDDDASGGTGISRSRQ